MKCPDFKIRLHHWLDAQRPGATGSLALGPELQAHASECSLCREQLAAAQSMLNGLHIRPHARPLADFSRVVVARAIADREQRKRRFARRMRFTVALAASILVMVIAGHILVPGPKKDDSSVPVVKQETPKPDEPQMETPSPALAKTLNEAREKMTALTDRLKEQTLVPAKQLLAAAPALEIPPMGAGVLVEEPVDATASLLRAGQEVKEGLEPVTRSARRAMSLFLREVSTFEVSKAGS